MKTEAFGEIGLLPSQFYRMRYADYILMQRGFANKKEWQEGLTRKAVDFIIAPWVKVNIKQYWKLRSDIDAGAAERALATLQRLKGNNISYVLEGGKIVEVINPENN